MTSDNPRFIMIGGFLQHGKRAILAALDKLGHIPLNKIEIEHLFRFFSRRYELIPPSIPPSRRSDHRN